MRQFAMGLALFVLAGCASQIMQGYVGKPLQAAMVDYGPPVNAFDMGDGRRAFQWKFTSSGVTPTYATNSGTAVPIGNSVWWTQNTTISGGQPYSSTCLYTLFARWDSMADVWRVESFQKPNLLCE